MLRAAIPIEAAVSLHLARCKPSVPCHQADHCARRDAALCDRRAAPIDGTLLRHACGTFCPLFVDARGTALETTS